MVIQVPVGKVRLILLSSFPFFSKAEASAMKDFPPSASLLLRVFQVRIPKRAITVPTSRAREDLSIRPMQSSSSARARLIPASLRKRSLTNYRLLIRKKK